MCGKLRSKIRFCLATGVTPSWARCRADAGGNYASSNGREGKKLLTKKEDLRDSTAEAYEINRSTLRRAVWVDALIDPATQREALIWALEAAALNPEVKEFKTGVLQT